MDLKKKFTAAVNHVKAHQAPYAALATLTACAVVETVYLNRGNIVDLNRCVKQMEKTGMGLWFANQENGKVIIMKLTNISNIVPRD